MTAARYLVRFDDVCPTMNWTVWEQVEGVLRRSGVRPVLAVIPDNRDPKMEVAAADEGFWERVRGWQAAGWAIAVHGYQHRYVTAERGLVGLRPRSEFAGLTAVEQEEKVAAGVDIFRREGVRADAWIAPAHSFDDITVGALAKHGVPVISDGLHWWPYRCRRGLVWVPQQLWGFRWRPFGVWTVCLHVNSWKAGNVTEFEARVVHYLDRIVDLPWIVDRYGTRDQRGRDSLQAALLGGYMRAGNRVFGRQI